MNLKESFVSSISTLKTNKTRSFLTMLGIIIGISSVILISTLGKGFQEGILENLNKISKNNIQIVVNPKPNTSVKKRALFVEEDLKYIKKIKGVKAVTLGLDTYARVDLPNTEDDNNWIEISAGNKDVIEAFSFKLLYGRGILETDNKETKKIAIIDDTLAMKKFGKVNAVGKEIEIKTFNGLQTYLVVGVIENIMKKLAETTKEDIFFMYIPYRTLKKYFYVADRNTLTVKVKDAKEKQKIGGKVIKMLERVKKSKDVYAMENLVQGLESFNKILSMANIFISAVATISLFVGGIGVMNIMLVSVTERTKEIGIRKAIGAKNRDILLQFLIEALTLTIIGGIIGLTFGYTSAQVVGKFIKIKPILSIKMMVVAVSVSSLIGLIFGVFPAMKASKLNPIDALRHE